MTHYRNVPCARGTIPERAFAIRFPARAIIITLLGCSVLGGCDLTGPSAGEVEVQVVRVVSSGPLVRHLQLTLSRPGPISVAYETPGAPALLVEQHQARREHAVMLTRLLPNSTYEYEIRTESGVWRDTLSTGSLPPDLAAVTIEGDLGVDDALMLFEVNHPDGFSGAVIVDDQGRIVWYFETTGALTGSTIRANGNFVFVDLDAGLLEVRPDGEPVDRFPHPPDRAIHHDVVETADGTLLFLTTDPREVDGETIVGDAIWSWRSGAEVDMQWSAFDHLSPAEDWGSRSRSEDWLHANSLSVGPHGNYIVSFNFLNQIISVAPDFSELEWRLGGVNSTIMADGEALFSGQHTAAELPDGHIIMFDNGIERAEPYSRALELRIEGDRAMVHGDLRPSPDNWSRAISSAFRTADGLTYITYGMPEGLAGSTGPVEAFAVGPSGETLGSLSFSGRVRSVYRGTPLRTIGGERLEAKGRSADRTTSVAESSSLEAYPAQTNNP